MAVPDHRRVPENLLTGINVFVRQIRNVRNEYAKALKEWDEKANAHRRLEATQLEAPTADVDVAMTDAERPPTPNLYSAPTGPIGEGLKKVKDFASSASGWTAEHLAYFQIVPHETLEPPDLFPKEFIIDPNDPTMVALRNDGFFEVDSEAIKHLRWDKTKLFSPTFVALMQLIRLRGSRTPTPLSSPETSPPMHHPLPRTAKDEAKEQIKRALYKAYPRPDSGESTSSGSAFVPSVSSLGSVMTDYGPREALSVYLLQSLLHYLARFEYPQVQAKTGKVWINGYGFSNYRSFP